LKIPPGLNQEKLELKRLLKEDVEEVSTANVPLYTLQMSLDESLEDLRQKLETRVKEIEELRSESQALCAEMEETPRTLVSDPLPSEKELQCFREYLDQIRDEQYNRFGKILELRDRIKSIMQKLELSSVSEYDKNLLSSTELKPTKLNIEKLEQLHDNFVDTFDRMEYEMKEMKKRLAQLWKYLDVTQSQQHKFDKYSETSQTNYDKMMAEVQRCEQIKRENIKIFIERVRLEIEEYWDKCLKSDAERMRFPSYTTNVFNEDVLELHEDELRDLKVFYENNESIFKLIKERNDLWSQLEILQNKEQDPKRYNNRGGQLLKEEKERKMLTLKLPKVEEKLIQMAFIYCFWCSSSRRH
jgi:Ase1/PRC1/MAP65 family protein